MRVQFEKFASASGRDLTTLVGILARVSQSGDREMIGDWSCEPSLNCKMLGQFEKFLSVSGRDLADLTSISPCVVLSVGGECLNENFSTRAGPSDEGALGKRLCE